MPTAARPAKVKTLCRAFPIRRPGSRFVQEAQGHEIGLANRQMVLCFFIVLTS